MSYTQCYVLSLFFLRSINTDSLFVITYYSEFYLPAYIRSKSYNYSFFLFNSMGLIAPDIPPATPPAITDGLSYPRNFNTTTTIIAVDTEIRHINSNGCFFIILLLCLPTHQAFRHTPRFFKWVLVSTFFILAHYFENYQNSSLWFSCLVLMFVILAHNVWYKSSSGFMCTNFQFPR